MLTRSLSVVLVLVAACSTGASVEQKFAAEDFDIVVLEANELPYARAHPVSLVDDSPTDEDGVRVYIRDGQTYYHPVVLAQRGLELIASADLIGDEQFLDLAALHGDRLISEAAVVDGSFYFPYKFDFALHGRDDAVLPAPWYSGMAEGQALSLFVRLYERTGEGKYLEAAEQTFETYQRLRNDGAEPWTVMVDEDGFLWLEEYPTPEADHHALNGHIFSIFGLYDFYMATGVGLDELRGSITTVARYFDDYRNPDGPSYYELKFGVTDVKYHAIHIRQLGFLAAMTGDERFSEMAGTLACDLPPDPVDIEGLSC